MSRIVRTVLLFALLGLCGCAAKRPLKAYFSPTNNPPCDSLEANPAHPVANCDPGLPEWPMGRQ